VTERQRLSGRGHAVARTWRGHPRSDCGKLRLRAHHRARPYYSAGFHRARDIQRKFL